MPSSGNGASGRSLPSKSQKKAARASRKERLLARKEDFVIPLLARRSYHLPGNDWWADWRQWFCNNHILFGICLHHPLHPLEWWERLLALVASVSFGLVATNSVNEIYRYDRETMEEEVLSLLGFPISRGMILLWTFGGLFHSIFDIVIWKIMACSCCHPGGFFGKCCCSKSFQNCGSYMLLPVIMMLLSLAAFMVLVRASRGSDEAAAAAAEYEQNAYNNNNNMGDDIQDGGSDDDFHVEWQNIDGAGSFFFLARYSVELMMAWFVYFPVIGTIMFSGILGCGRLPVLGGRPKDIRLVEEESKDYRRV